MRFANSWRNTWVYCFLLLSNNQCAVPIGSLAWIWLSSPSVHYDIPYLLLGTLLTLAWPWCCEHYYKKNSKLRLACKQGVKLYISELKCWSTFCKSNIGDIPARQNLSLAISIIFMPRMLKNPKSGTGRLVCSKNGKAKVMKSALSGLLMSLSSHKGL